MMDSTTTTITTTTSSATTSTTTIQQQTQHQQSYMEIALAMQRCLVVKTRRHRLKIHKKCFVGRDACDFLMDYLNLPTRQEALEVGREMNEQIRCFEHVTRTHELKDENVFYRFTNFSNRKDNGCPLKEIARAFQKGVPTEKRTIKLRTYKKCFKGKHAVEYLVQSKYAENRTEAVALARRLQAEFDLFVPVSGSDRKFHVDSYYRMLLPKFRNPFDGSSEKLFQRPEVQILMDLWLLIFGFVASSLYVCLFQGGESLGFMMASTLGIGAAVQYSVFGTGVFAVNWFKDSSDEDTPMNQRRKTVMDASRAAMDSSASSEVPDASSMGESSRRSNTSEPDLINEVTDKKAI